MFLFFGVIIFLIIISIIFTNRVNGITDHMSYGVTRYLYSNKIKNIVNNKDVVELPVFEKPLDTGFPKIIHQTHKTREMIPEYYVNNLKELNKDWEYNFHDNSEARLFLQEFYGNKFVEKFDSLEKGPHKSDLWRLCVLYKYGGCYIDADIEMQISFDKLIKVCNENLIIPCSEMINSSKRLFNALIIAKPMDESIGKCIQKLMLVDNKTLVKFYHFNLEIMHETLKNEINYKIYERYLPDKMINFSLSPKDCYLTLFNSKKIAKSKRDDYN